MVRTARFDEEPLTDDERHLVAHWSTVQWAPWYPDDTLEWNLGWYAQQADAGGALPFGLVARRDGDGAVVGTISVVADDELPGFGHLTPWLAALYVEPSERGHGVARQLVEGAIEHCGALGFASVYLWAIEPFLVDWYARLGFTVVAPATVGPDATPVTVMALALKR